MSPALRDLKKMPFASLLTVEESASRLRIHRQTLYAWIREGRGPQVVRLGSRCLIPETNLSAFVDRHAVPLEVDAA